ncbi:MAG: hypothetical protein JWP91_2626 [Fibrobacteres bacterium]|nr:hypothetical protein [Fibrobacterota bacterium]
MKAATAVLSALILPAILRAQTPTATDDPFTGFRVFDPGISGGQFLIALVSGVILAYCFQWLLTNLSVATGLSALQGVTDSGKREKARRKAMEKDREKAEKDRERMEEDPEKFRKENEPDEWDDKAVKIESGIGIWAMVTSAIALFLACWLAVELIRLQNNYQAVILGLVIWSVFLGTMMYLEGAATMSLLGTISSAVRNGVGALASPFKAAAGKLADSRAESAQRKQTVQTAEEVAAAVRKELFGEEEDAEAQGPGVMDKIREYTRSTIKPKAMDLAHMGQEMKSLLTDPELIEMAKRGELQNLDRNHFAEIVAGRTDLEKDQVDRMVDSLYSTWSKFLGENAPAQPPKYTRFTEGEPSPAMATASGGSASAPQGVIGKYQRFREFLRSTGRDELQPERIEQEIKTLLMDPGTGLSQIREHAKELDRESLVQVLSHRQDMTPEEANRIADQIDLARSKALSAKEQAEHRAEEVRDRTMSRIRDHVYAINRPELDFEGFKGDFLKLFDDPKAGYASLKQRLQGIDRETVIAALSSVGGMSREDAEKTVEKGEAIKAKAEQATDKVKEKAGQATNQAKAGVDKVADKIMEAKDNALERARKVEEETKRRMEEAKRISLEQAEAARKVTATAAWWLLAIAVVSGAAAALGGLTAAATQ